MMRCHVCGKLLNTENLEQYFNEVLNAHYGVARNPPPGCYPEHTEGVETNDI